MSELQGHNGQLKSIVERIERLLEDKAAIVSDIKDVFAESKSSGFDVKALRTIIRLRAMNPDDRATQDAILDTYKNALGIMLIRLTHTNSETY
jgi:uncharacterized protein (UPF0335 family)